MGGAARPEPASSHRGAASVPIRILLVEDNRIFARLVRERLDPERFEVTHVERLSDAGAILRAAGADVVLLDLTLPDATQEETIAWLTALADEVPIVVFTGRHDDELAAALVRAGVQDCLEKRDLHPELLSRMARHALERARCSREVRTLRQSQLRAKDDLLGHVSHELRTPLNVVYQYATLLKDGLLGGVTSEQASALDVLLRNVGDLRRMIGDLLDATRSESHVLSIDARAIDVAALVCEVATAMSGEASARGVALRMVAPGLLPFAHADASRVRQVLTNLVDNAIKFTPTGGVVTMSVEHLDRFVMVRVDDTGCGIPRSEHTRIFQRLYQVSGGTYATRRGLGLGLHLCRDMVRRMGGAIWVDSEVGKGSRFAFTLPVDAVEAWTT